jgi:hypothetical protein
MEVGSIRNLKSSIYLQRVITGRNHNRNIDIKTRAQDADST